MSSATAGDVVTIAGDGTDSCANSASAPQANGIAQPFGIVVGPDKALYVCSVGCHKIYRVDLKSRDISVVAGNGRKGFSGNGGPATEARLNEPYEIRFADNGDMYLVEMQNHAVRRVSAADGRITLVAGNGRQGFSGDGGPATQAQLNRPHSIALDNAGNLYICDIGNHRIRVVDLTTGVIDTFGGTGERKQTSDGAPLAGTALNGPRALDFDGKHSLVLALREGNAIFRIDLRRRTLHHIAGTGQKGYSGDGGPARQARLSGPKGISIGPGGDIYFADTESHTVRVVRRQSGTIHTVVGDGKRGDGPEGRPHSCRLDRPHGVYVDSDGTLYIGDSNNHRVRMLPQ